MSDSEDDDEFDDWGKKDAPKRKAVISDDDDSFAPEPSATIDSDVDSPAPPPKAPVTWVQTSYDLSLQSFFSLIILFTSTQFPLFYLAQEEGDKEQIDNREKSCKQIEL